MKKYMFFCNIYYNGLQDYMEAFKYADSMLVLIENSKDKKFLSKYEAKGHFSMGDVNFGLMRYDQAFKY